jgi:hypothetical protein
LATFKARFPPRREIILVFVICSVPIHIWAAIALFRAIPSWVLSMSVWDMIGVMAYPLSFALLESCLVLAGLLITAIILPPKLYRNWFVSQSTIIIFLTSIWAVLLQIYGQDWGMWSSRGLIGLLPLVVVIIILAILNAKFKRSQNVLEALAERMVVLGFLYVMIDVFFLLVLIFRNLFHIT